MRKFLLYVILLGFNYSIAFAQLTSSENNEKPYIPSWDTYEFMKYDLLGLHYIQERSIILFQFIRMKMKISIIASLLIMPRMDLGSTTKVDILDMDGR